jgi:hypothetical protein
MSMVNSLLPKSIMYQESYNKLTGFLLDVQKGWQLFVDKVANSYEIDTLGEDDLIALIKSFSLLDVYNALPPLYRGSIVDQNGLRYFTDPSDPLIPHYTPDQIPKDKLPFARKFLRLMLKNRKDLGVAEMFDSIMGMLGVPNDSFVILQDFIYHDSIAGNTVFERVLYKSNAVTPQTAAPLIKDVMRVYPPNPAPANYYTPTQTITVDVLNNTLMTLGDTFISALKIIANFMKPTQVIFKNITAAVYLETSGFYNINMGQRGDYTTPDTFRVEGAGAFAADNATNRITRAIGDFVEDGYKPGMLVIATGFVSNIITNVRITEVAAGYLTLNIADIVLVNEVETLVLLTRDYDHSWQDGRVSFIEVEFAEEDLALPKPLWQVTRDTRHPVIHEPGLVPTLATGGSYVESGASDRLETLDTSHYNNLNARAGGSGYFGFCVAHNIKILDGKLTRKDAVTWESLGFVVGGIVSVDGFAIASNNIADADGVKILAISGLTMTVDKVLIDEDPEV